jgi:hypothetical protein
VPGLVITGAPNPPPLDLASAWSGASYSVTLLAVAAPQGSRAPTPAGRPKSRPAPRVTRGGTGADRGAGNGEICVWNGPSKSCLFLLLISQVVQAVDHEELPCTPRDPSCAQFSCVLETGTLALFVSIDCVWGAKVVIKISEIAADPIVLHSGCASRIAADIRITANLIVI